MESCDPKKLPKKKCLHFQVMIQFCWRNNSKSVYQVKYFLAFFSGTHKIILAFFLSKSSIIKRFTFGNTGADPALKLVGAEMSL